ncbi:MAG: GIY-YIG nuclease family protein, partial [Paludibacteraceae bacterium]|nr:GIY-YIG nuclease family protein [Paludibacteraceae bacterium]
MATNKKWDEFTCLVEAKKYKTARDFQKGSPGAYNAAQKNNWLYEYVWLERKCKPNGYWNEETCRIEALKYKSRSEFEKGCRGAYKVACKNKWLDGYKWLEQKHKPNNYWNEETCRAESLKYKTRSEFQKACSGAYLVASKNGWIEDYDWLEKKQNAKGYWTKERCCEEAKKYFSRGDVQNGCKAAYGVAWKNGWLDEYSWFSDPRTTKKWNYETCQKEALKYKSRVEFVNASPGAYKVARENNWLDHYDWMERPVVHNKKWDKESCREEAKKYKSKSDFSKGSGGAYNVACANGWLDDYDWFDVLWEKKWDEESCRKEALKYVSRKDFADNMPGAYRVARVNGWLDDYDWFLEPPKRDYWDIDTCLEEAKKYHSKLEFARNCRRGYDVARENGWLNDYDWFMESPRRNYWNENTCKEEAMKYTTRSDFQDGSSGAYGVASKNGWLEQYDWLELKQKPKGFWNKETCREEALKYKSRSEMQKNCIGAYVVARKNGWLDEYTWLKNEKLFSETGRWYNVYVYEWKELNSIYVGISIDVKKRQLQHQQEGSSVFNFSKKHNVEIPEMEIIEDHLIPTQAQELEAYYIDYYKE